ncbi:hypothetical protein ABBQ32_009284 [Trebouxia sp. C0010 RCD-2024]
MSLIDANSNTTNNQHSKRSRKGLSAKQTLRSLRNSTPVGMSSPALDTTQDSGSDDETFWDEGKAAGDALGTTFGGASIAGGEREPAVHSSPEYDSTKVAAYASSRMPACYAVLFRVFDELHLHLPHFSPSTMLDFGSGPGTAIWAAREVWERYPQQVTAVEPSAAMRDLAVELQHAISKQHGPGRPACSIQWRRQLHPTMLPSKRSKLQQTNRQSYDLVVASYVLTEMRSDAERQQAVDMLWRQTKDVLVLLEPGTPSGSSYVRHARTQILEAGKAQNQQAASQQGVLKQPAEAGAYVVAPCPHDGQCPMEGTRSWCHFAQRFQRSDLQRRHKVLSGGHGARTYQDERFSYVVLRRGPRPGPETVPDLTVARQRQVDAPDAVQRAIEAGVIPRSPKQMPATHPEADVDASSEEDSDAESAAAWSAMNLPDMDESTRQLILDSMRAHAASDEEEDEDDLRQMLNGDPAMLADASAVVAQQEDEIQAAASEVTADLPARAKAPLLPFKKLDSDTLEKYEQWDQEYWQTNMPEAVDATVAAANIWSRIIRPPRKRGKHIIIDVCSSREHVTDPDAVDTSHGRLVRQVVASTDKKTWLGPGGYRLVRKSRWGDLWPKYYQDYALTHKFG